MIERVLENLIDSSFKHISWKEHWSFCFIARRGKGCDEICSSIPGPTCGTELPALGADPENEGLVHIHRGMQRIGNLPVGAYDWRNPVTRITVSRVRGKKAR